MFNEIKRKQVPIYLGKNEVDAVLCWATDYLHDAKYYKSIGKLETSLTSVAYCEGLLDTLRLIGAVEFEWSTKKENKE